MMKRLQTVIIVFLIFVLSAYVFDSCQKQKKYEALISQLKQYEIENKAYQKQRLKDSSLLIVQEQTILSKDEAIKLGLLEMDKRMKSVESQLSAKINVVIKEKDVPFIPNGYADTSGWVRDQNGNVVRTDSISVPQNFGLSEKWLSLNGQVTKTGLKLDSLKLTSNFKVTFGKEKSGFLKLGSKPVVQIKSDNPYLDLSSINNIVIKEKKKFYKSPLFIFGVGLASGIFLVK